MEAELREELQFHLKEEADERQALGLAEDEARWAARRELGNFALVQEDTRAVWGWTMLEQLGQDLRYAFRTMAANRLFSTLVVLCLALGIGANTAIFSLVNAVLLRPLPYQDPGRLAMLWTDDVKRGIHEEGTSYLNFVDWKSQSTAFADLAVCTRGNSVTLTVNSS